MKRKQQKAEEDNNITEMLPDDTTVCVWGGELRSHHICQPAKAEAFNVVQNITQLCFGFVLRARRPHKFTFGPFFLLLASASAAAALEKQHFCFF